MSQVGLGAEVCGFRLVAWDVEMNESSFGTCMEPTQKHKDESYGLRFGG